MANRIEQLTAQSATQRVADFLVSLTPCIEGPCTIALPYDKSLIAGRLGLKPESLSRVFAKLRAVGIDVRASDVVVYDVATLQNLVASERIRPRGVSNLTACDGGQCPGTRTRWERGSKTASSADRI
jgi:hypothetical protein